MKLSTVLFLMAMFFIYGSLIEKGFALTIIGVATGILAIYVKFTEE